MHTFKPGWRTFLIMLPLFVFLELLLEALEHYDFSYAGVTIVVHILIVFQAHGILMTGENLPLWKAAPDSQMPKPSFAFFGWMLLLFAIALGVGVFAAVVLGPVMGVRGQVEGLVILGAMFAFWVALSVFGMVLPRNIYRNLKDGSAAQAVAVQGQQMPFIALWLAVWTLLFMVSIAAPLLYTVYVAQNEWVVLGLGVVFGIASYLPTCLTASVLSHAFLRANNLPPRGLITRV